MKRLLLAPLLLILTGCQSNPTQWPTSWDQFDPPPSKKTRPNMVVYFTESIEEACKEFKKALNLRDMFQTKYDVIHEPLKDRLMAGTISDEEYNKIIDDEENELNLASQDLWPRQFKSISTAVEVLRQADYPDWNLYSRYNYQGVGDLIRREKGKETPNKRKYGYRATPEAMKVCIFLGHSF